jgi:hypothetical protein
MCYGFGLESDIEGLPDPMADDGSDDGSGDGSADGPKAVGSLGIQSVTAIGEQPLFPGPCPHVDIRR